MYVDECGINTDLKREYGRCVRGKKVEDTKRGRKFHRVNIVAAQVHGAGGVKKIAPLCYQGSMTGEKFEAWVESNLMSCAPKGSTIILDNARFHRKKKLEPIGEKSGVSFLFLPPYSPDFNPIEKGWANMKRELRDTYGLCDLLEPAMYQYWH